MSNLENLLQLVHHNDFNLEDLKTFLENHDKPQINQLIYKKTGDSILHICAKLNRVHFIQFLINFWGASIIDIKNNDDKTPLHEACQFSQVEAVEILIKHGANVNAIKRADWSPLMLACTKTGKDPLKIVQVLLNSSAYTNLRNKDGWTALHLASREGDFDIVETILKHGADYKIRTKNGRNVLHVAALHGHVTLVKHFLNLLDPNEKDNSGNTTLHEAIFSNNIELIDMLLTKCDVSSSVNNVGFGCLHLAASENLTDIIKHLVLNCKVDINLKSTAGFTPLHCAARKKQEESVALLIELGARTDITDNNGRTANDYFLL